MLSVEFRVEAVQAVAGEAAPLLDGDVVVAPVKGVQVCASGEAQLETHFRVAHGIAVLFAVVTD